MRIWSYWYRHVSHDWLVSAALDGLITSTLTVGGCCTCAGLAKYYQYQKHTPHPHTCTRQTVFLIKNNETCKAQRVERWRGRGFNKNMENSMFCRFYCLKVSLIVSLSRPSITTSLLRSSITISSSRFSITISLSRFSITLPWSRSSIAISSSRSFFRISMALAVEAMMMEELKSSSIAL